MTRQRIVERLVFWGLALALSPVIVPSAIAWEVRHRRDSHSLVYQARERWRRRMGGEL